MDGHARAGDAQNRSGVVDEMCAIVSVLNFVPDVSGTVETESETEPETVVELNVAWPTAGGKRRAQISVGQN